MATLLLQQPYKRIEALTSPPLPALTVLTGRNGTGKTQLLEAIANGSVAVLTGGDQVPLQEISLISHRDFVFTDQGVMTQQHVTQVKQQYVDATNEVAAQIKAQNIALSPSQKRAVLKTAKKSDKGVYDLTQSDLADPKLFDDYSRYVQAIRSYVSIEQRPDLRLNYARRVVEVGDTFVDSLSREDILSTVINEDFNKGVIPSQLSFVIFDYSLQWHRNCQRHYENETFGTKYSVLTEKEFERRHGPKPWVVINQLLTKFSGFRYKLDFDEKRMDPFAADYAIGFASIDDGGPSARISPQDLSSGEQTILAFATSLFSAASNRNFPKLLLLDEVDATLHPSMCTSFMEGVQDVLVKGHGVSVMLVTHSPSTVASAITGSIHILKPEGTKISIEPQGRAGALTDLSSGYVGITQEKNKSIIEHRVSASEKDMLFFEGDSDAIYIKNVIDRFYPNLNDVVDVSGCEGSGGLNNLYKVIIGGARSILTHGRKAILVYDCDAQMRQETRSYVAKKRMSKVSENPISIGIENLLPQTLVRKAQQANPDFFYMVENELRVVPAYKVELAQWVNSHADDEELIHLKELVEKIKSDHL